MHSLTSSVIIMKTALLITCSVFPYKFSYNHCRSRCTHKRVTVFHVVSVM